MKLGFNVEFLFAGQTSAINWTPRATPSILRSSTIFISIKILNEIGKNSQKIPF